MKSLMILSFLLTAGIMPITNAQIPTQLKTSADKEGKDITTVLFPDLQRDLSNLKAKEVKPKPDLSIISSPLENRLFTNYKPPVAGSKASARSLKPASPVSSSPSDLSVKEASNKLNEAQAAHPVRPVVIPTQGSEINDLPVKKINSVPLKKKS